MNKTKLVWRLANRPTPAEVMDLKDRGIIDKEEAREILFSLDTEEDRDKKSLESEIKFLRELVQRLASDKTRIVEVIKEVYKPYERWSWYTPYVTWCGGLSGQNVYTNGSNLGTTLTGIQTTNNSLALSATYAVTDNSDFSSIKTF